MGCGQSSALPAENKPPPTEVVVVNDDAGAITIDEPKIVNFKPIHSAVRWNKPVSEVEQLLDSLEAVNCADETNGNRPIHIASQNGHNDLVKLLIKKKADLASKNLKGNTALHMAVGYDYYETAQLLMKAGADPEVVNEAGIAAKFGLEGDKAIGIAALVAAASHNDVVVAFNLCEEVIEKLNKVNFIQAGLKAKKGLGEQWTSDLQDKFKEITGKLA